LDSKQGGILTNFLRKDVGKFTFPREAKECPKEGDEAIHINSLVSETLEELLVLWQGSQL
jgi:hypothetical protein